MIDTVHIEWGTGYMNLWLPGFFPCPMNKFKKILKLIREDWDHQEEIRETLKVHFQNRIDELKAEMKNKANEYVNLNTKVKERTQHIKEKKFANGLRMSKEQVKDQRQFLKDDKEAARKTLAEFKALERKAQQFPKLLQMLEEEANG